LRYETARYFHKNWHDLFLTVSGIVPMVEFEIAVCANYRHAQTTVLPKRRFFCIMKKVC
jgi:hypothetical protein